MLRLAIAASLAGTLGALASGVLRVSPAAHQPSPPRAQVEQFAAMAGGRIAAGDVRQVRPNVLVATGATETCLYSASGRPVVYCAPPSIYGITLKRPDTGEIVRYP